MRIVERTVPARRACLFGPDLGGKMRKGVSDRQRRRGKHPGQRMTLAVGAKDVADLQRRLIQAKAWIRARRTNGPAPHRRHRSIDRAASPWPGSGPGNDQAPCRAPTAGPARHRVAQGVGERHPATSCTLGFASSSATGHGGQILRDCPAGPAPADAARSPAAGSPAHHRPHARTRCATSRAKSSNCRLLTDSPKKFAATVGQLMCLVDDDAVRARQDLAEALLAQGHVGAQQVVIDHHHLGLLGAAPRLDQMTARPSRTVLPETVVRGGGDHWPDGASSGSANSAISPELVSVDQANPRQIAPNLRPLRRRVGDGQSSRCRHR
jgi:hypothetical protein